MVRQAAVLVLVLVLVLNKEDGNLEEAARFAGRLKMRAGAAKVVAAKVEAAAERQHPPRPTRTPARTLSGSGARERSANV